ncbi:hypothetical protein UPYG_G00028130 [Umbra pygmaea]|uniref:Cystatin kininogen-type domain-containing protein n=1 Tax=Umbra pygmaea TaxID=75934 RepID=A0ABD0Y991_UMBPY
MSFVSLCTWDIHAIIMKLRLSLCVLVAFSLQLWAPGNGQELDPAQVLMFCDDQNVEAAVNVALLKFNKNLPHGNQLALYQIVGASKAQNESGTQYFVQFSGRVTDCPAGEGKVWRDCNYLPTGNKMPSPCNATVHMSGTNTEVQAVFCDPVEGPVVAKVSRCLGCPENMDVENEDLKDPVTYSIAKFNNESKSSHHFVLYNIRSASRQVIAGLRYKLTFNMRKSNCSKAEHKELSDECHPDRQDVEFANCNSTVDVAPWRDETPQTHVECAQGLIEATLQGAHFARRRPPGWSPLRNFYNFDKEPTPTSASVQEQSSEESQEGSVTHASPDAALPSVDQPFHCPSSPWKQFVPSTSPIIQDQSPAGLPTGDKGFADSDLLGNK